MNRTQALDKLIEIEKQIDILLNEKHSLRKAILCKTLPINKYDDNRFINKKKRTSSRQINEMICKSLQHNNKLTQSEIMRYTSLGNATCYGALQRLIKHNFVSRIKENNIFYYELATKNSIGELKND